MSGQGGKRVVMAVDCSDNSLRAVEHVAETLRGGRGYLATLLHVIAEPEPDYFGNQPARSMEWLAGERGMVGGHMERYREILLEAGFDPGEVEVSVVEKRCPSLSDCILGECAARGASIVALGRQGRGAKEELLMGSVSKAVVHKSKGRAVWVVT